jgi:hypothetical protein
MTVSANKAKGNDSAKFEHAAAVIERFSGVELDAAAEAEIAATLIECAARKREYGGGVYDRNAGFVPKRDDDPLWLGTMEPPGGWVKETEPFDAAEPFWETIGDGRYD